MQSNCILTLTLLCFWAQNVNSLNKDKDNASNNLDNTNYYHLWRL